MDWYTIHNAIATVCSSRGGHLLDQIHLRLSCPPFILREIQNQMGGFAALDVCQSVRDN